MQYGGPGRKMDERQWVRLAQAGDAEAAEQLVRACYQPVFAYFYKNTGQYHLSCDLTQETFLRMAGALGSYRPWGSFRGWLFTIAANCLKSHWRALARRPEEPCPPEELQDNLPQASDPFRQSARHSDLEAALALLPQEQREAVILRYYHGFTVREIAQITGAGASAVKARLRYALAKLRKELEGYEEDAPLPF